MESDAQLQKSQINNRQKNTNNSIQQKNQSKNSFFEVQKKQSKTSWNNYFVSSDKMSADSSNNTYQLSAKNNQKNQESIHQVASRGVSGSGSKLPHFDTMQKTFPQHDLSNVQAYTGSTAAKACSGIGATAYATGNKVAFNSSSPSLHTVAHETTHVIQQRKGVQLKGGIGQVGDKYEVEADKVADSVVQNKSSSSTPTKTAVSTKNSIQQSALQLMESDDVQFFGFSNPFGAVVDAFNAVMEWKTWVENVLHDVEQVIKLASAIKASIPLLTNGTLKGFMDGLKGIADGITDFDPKTEQLIGIKAKIMPFVNIFKEIHKIYTVGFRKYAKEKAGELIDQAVDMARAGLKKFVVWGIVTIMKTLQDAYLPQLSAAESVLSAIGFNPLKMLRTKIATAIADKVLPGDGFWDKIKAMIKKEVFKVIDKIADKTGAA